MQSRNLQANLAVEDLPDHLRIRHNRAQRIDRQGDKQMTDLLTEQRFIFSFIEAIFSAIVNQRNRALRTAMEKDPQFRSIVAKLEQGRKELAAWAEKQAHGDPEAQKDLETIRRLTAR